MSAEEYKAYCLNKYQNRNSIIQNAKELDNASRQLLLIDNKISMYRSTQQYQLKSDECIYIL